MNYIEKIRALREDNDITQEEIAKHLNIDRKTYNRIENGSAPLRFEQAIKIAKFYNISLDYIAGFIETPKSTTGNTYTTKNITAIQGNITGGNVKINIKN